MEVEKVKTAWYDFIDQNGAVIARGNHFLEKISMTNSIDTVPTMKLKIPLAEMPKEPNWNTIQVKVYLDKKYIFWGIIDEFNIDFADYSVELDLSHIVAEHRTQYMPVNLIVKSMPLKNLYNHMDFNMPGWVYEFSPKAAETRIEYTFSGESKLEAISEAVDQTEDIHWRVKLTEDKVLQFSEFGDIKPIVLSTARGDMGENDCGEDNNYPVMLTEPILSMNFTNHVNRIVVLCGDIDKDVEHLTLKWMYHHPAYWTEGFPIGMYDLNVNQQDEPQYADEDLGNSNNANTISVSNDTVHVKTGIRP